MNVLAPEVRNFVRRKVQNVAQIYSEHFFFFFFFATQPNKQKTTKKKRIGTAITKSEFESQIYVYIFREVELKTD